MPSLPTSTILSPDTFHEKAIIASIASSHHARIYDCALAQTTPASFENLLLDASSDNAEAQYHLGVMYDEGQDVPQDYIQAKAWYEKAALQNHDKA